MIVHISDEQHDLPLKTGDLPKLVESVLSLEEVHADEVSIYFVSTEVISSLHADFFDDPSTTDCISFPLDEEGEWPRHLGEIFVCPATAIAYAEKHGKDPYEETKLYIVHGLLHLLGYDDMTPTEKQKMRRAEARHMKLLHSLALI